MISIAIDGPSGAGKSTLAKGIAARLGIVYVDTGALYRTVGLAVTRAGIAADDKAAVTEALAHIAIRLAFEGGAQHVYLNGEDVGGLIRTPEISRAASDVSAIPAVRAFLLETQRSLAREASVIMDGRDIGTVILPQADVKIFLTAGSESRARRRCAELREKGMNVSYEEILTAMTQRDKNDSQREIAPAVPAADAVILDNSDLDLDKTLEAALSIIREKGFEA